MRTLLKALILSCILTGCIITQYDGLHNIINENLEVYQEQENIEFTNIAAIFKSYANLTNTEEYKSFNELENDTENFIKNLKDNNISENYPVIATKEERYVASSFLRDLLKCLKDNDIGISRYQNFINQALKTYVTEIMSHEEKIPQ